MINFQLKDGCIRSGINLFEVLDSDGEYMGEIFIRTDDFKYHFCPDDNCYVDWSAEVLREIANKLDELNEK